MRKIFWTVLFLCSCFCYTAKAENLNWCGKYFENNNHGFIIIPQEDIAKGRKNCSLKAYNSTTRTNGSIIVPLNFKNRSKIANWRKFSQHIIVVRGKMRNNMITNTRFVRDLGA